MLLAALILSAVTAYAETTGAAGNAELNLVVAILTGNIGLVLGLGVTVIGIITFVKGDTTQAIWTILLGVLITMTPGIYNGLRLIACPIAESLGGKCGT